MNPLAYWPALIAALAAVLSIIGAARAAAEFGLGAAIAGVVCAAIFAASAIALFISIRRRGK